MRTFLSLLLLGTLLLTNISAMKRRGGRKAAGDPDLLKKISRFAPTTLTANTASLSPGDRKALSKIIEAARLLDPLFLRQVWSGNDALKKKLEAENSADGRQRLHYFLINDGPWSRLDNNEPFIEGVPREKPPHANFYPDDITKEEFNSWLAGLPVSEKEKATGYFYLIRRGPDKKLTTQPYSEAYRELLDPAAKLLNEAAALTTNN